LHAAIPQGCSLPQPDRLYQGTWRYSVSHRSACSSSAERSRARACSDFDHERCGITERNVAISLRSIAFVDRCGIRSVSGACNMDSIDQAAFVIMYALLAEHPE
jgi:hypothetical protein